MSSGGAEWWRDAVIYQIYPRSFRDADGDGVGDLRGIIERLDHVASLGVDGVWVSPFFPSPMHDFGYDVSDYRDVDPLFGSLADFDRLLAEAHARRLRVIIDQVWSHTSHLHPWFAESRSGRAGPKSDWYVWADPRPDGTPPNNWLATFGGPAWTWDGSRQQYYFHNFLPQQPDLNLRNPAVQDAILDVARFWLDRGVDGFRLDVANCFMHDPSLRDNPPRGGEGPHPAPYRYQRHVHDRSHPDNLAFLARIRAVLDGYDGDRVAIAEISDEDNLGRMMEYAAPGRLHSAYSFHFLRGPLDAAFFRDAVEAFFGGGPGGSSWPCWSFSNHDVARVVSRWGPAAPGLRPAFAALANALLTSLPGTVFVYQGEELGLTQVEVPRERLADPEAIANWPRHRNRDGARTPMPWHGGAADLGFGSDTPWLPFGPDHGALAVDRQDADEDSVLNRFRAHLAWRRAVPGLSNGGIAFREAPEGVLGFDRATAAESGGLRFAFNLTATPAEWDGFGDAKVLAGTGRIEGGCCRLPPYGYVVAERTGA